MIYSVKKILRLRSQCSVFGRFKRVKSSQSGDIFKKKDQNSYENNKFQDLLQQYKDKITFSSYLEHEKLELGHFKYYIKTIAKAKREKDKELEQKSLPPLPLSLKYYVEKERLLNNEPTVVAETRKVFKLPFANTPQVEINQDDIEISKQTSVKTESDEFDRSSINKWMTNYEHFDDTHLFNNIEEASDDEVDDNTWCKNYGTPDPTVPISQVPCGGCGALLHCNEPAIPGYLPSELFKEREFEELKTLECQRCHFLKEYNIALDVTVQPEEYEKLLQSIR